MRSFVRTLIKFWNILYKDIDLLVALEEMSGDQSVVLFVQS